MNNDDVIVVESVSKTYKVYNRPIERLKQVISPKDKKYYREFSSLKNISFSIKKGETVGIVGGNGAGKSTLLQIISGTLTPSSGSVKINGKIGALLELGSGFNPDFTGRENVLLSGAIHGISEKEMLKRMEAIESFADIGDFIDQPVKTYSSGMFARLAFSVNMHVDADVLIVDEVLSVGDHFFQAKCMKAINDLSKNGCTILMVSHSQATIKALCNRAILLHKGSLELDSNYCDEVFDRYFSLSLAESRDQIESQNVRKLSFNTTENSSDVNLLKVNDKSYVSQFFPEFTKRISERFGNQKANFIEAVLIQNDQEKSFVNTGEKCTIRTWVKFREDIDDHGEIGVVIRTLEGIDLFAINSFFNNMTVHPQKSGETRIIDFEFPVQLGPGKYSVTLGYRAPVQGEYIDKVFNALIFEVVNTSPRVVPLLFDIEGNININ